MKIRTKEIMNLLVIISTIILLFVLKTYGLYSLIAILLIFFSLGLLIKVKNDIYLVFMIIPIFYANYSIAVGEFLEKNLQVTFNAIRFIDYGNYVDALIMLCIFSIIFYYTINPKKNNFSFVFKSNSIIYYSLCLVVVLINLLFFDRSDTDTYIVRSNSLHGYTYLLILFMSYYSGNIKFRKWVTVFVIVSIALQSLYYGGRQAIIPAVIVSLLTIVPEKLNYKNIFILVSVGIVLLTIIAQLRGTAKVGFSTIFQLFRSGLFVQDTSVYAFNSTVTHLYVTSVYSFQYRLLSFLAFLVSIVFGQGNAFTELGNVTLIARNVVTNLGGGITISYFYFWTGWIGVFLSPFILATIINKLNSSKKPLANLILVALTATASTWYLYSPLQFFRIALVLIPLLYLIFKVIHYETLKMKG